MINLDNVKETFKKCCIQSKLQPKNVCGHNFLDTNHNWPKNVHEIVGRFLAWPNQINLREALNQVKKITENLTGSYRSADYFKYLKKINLVEILRKEYVLGSKCNVDGYEPVRTPVQFCHYLKHKFFSTCENALWPNYISAEDFIKPVSHLQKDKAIINYNFGSDEPVRCITIVNKYNVGDGHEDVLDKFFGKLNFVDNTAFGNVSPYNVSNSKSGKPIANEQSSKASSAGAEVEEKSTINEIQKRSENLFRNAVTFLDAKKDVLYNWGVMKIHTSLKDFNKRLKNADAGASSDANASLGDTLKETTSLCKEKFHKAVADTNVFIDETVVYGQHLAEEMYETAVKTLEDAQTYYEEHGNEIWAQLEDLAERVNVRGKVDAIKEYAENSINVLREKVHKGDRECGTKKDD